MDDAELKKLILQSGEETRRHLDVVEKRIQSIENAGVETRRHFDVVAEGLRQDVRLVAEAVARGDQKAEDEDEALREGMARGFAETQAMIRFSYSELERRLRTLESVVAGMQARIERLESSSPQ
jgi:hypothetical protein